MNKKRNAIEWAIHYRQIVILVVCCLIAFGIYSLPNMRKNEFPDFTIRQGLVVAVAPGNTVEEMVEQVTKPLEDYIFTYKEVKKNKTFSTTRDGIVYIQVELVDELNNKDEFWSKFKHGVSVFKSELPSNVLAVQVVDDFGDTSALLITMESEEKTYRELDDYMEELRNRLRRVESVGRMSVSGMRKEQISVYLDNDRLARYGLNDQMLAVTLFSKGFSTTGGQVKDDAYVQPVYEKFSFLDLSQTFYNKLLDHCFRHPLITVSVGILSVVLGSYLMGGLPQKLMPIADRNQFAVEITLPTGMAIDRTVAVSDSIAHILRRDPRVVSVTSFNGCASPRFHTAYAPQIAGTNYAQLVVNTVSSEATEEVLDEYTPRYTGYFPDAWVRFKQLSYSQAVYPVEIRISGENVGQLRIVSDQIVSMLRAMPEFDMVRTNYNEPLAATRVVLKEDEASRLGVNNLAVETTLAMRYGSGLPITSLWEGDYNLPVVLKGMRADSASSIDLEDELIPVMAGIDAVPLRQVAQVEPCWKEGQIVRRNGVYTITVQADPGRDQNAMALTKTVVGKIDKMEIPDGVSLAYGGEVEEDEENMPLIMSALVVAAVIIFFILVVHFHKLNIALLIFVSISLCVLGAATGVLIHGLDFGVTCVLGLISLMGIIVRNGIIMIDYAEELRKTEKLSVRDAIYQSARRRMRPIFLTSAAASMGVVPMILGKSGLWMPMGTVICYGTLITMVLLLTVLPVSYWLIFRGSTRKRAQMAAIERE